MYSKEEVERIYKAGKMPDRYYYQLNGKTADENWRDQHSKIQKNVAEYREKHRQQKDISAELAQQVEQELEPLIENTIDELLGGFAKFSG